MLIDSGWRSNIINESLLVDEAGMLRRDEMMECDDAS